MPELIHEYETRILDSNGNAWVVRALGDPQSGGTWFGWLEFRSLATPARVLQTDRETTQPNRDALRYWATGLEPIYLEGAFARAR